MTNTYERGNVVRLTASFADLGNTAVDPSTVTLRIKQPDATLAVYTYPGGGISKDSTGVYHYDLSITESGDWYYRFEGAGAVTAAAETLLHVHRSNVLS